MAMLFYAAAVLGFVMTMPADAVFWAVDTAQLLTQDEVCRPADETIRDYLVKGHWTEAPWRRVFSPLC